MKKTSQLPKDDELMANSDTLAYGEQSSEMLPEDAEDLTDASGDDDDMEESSGEDDATLSDDDVSPDADDDVEDDGTPVLTEEDLEEIDLDEDEADDIEWEPTK